MKAAEATRLRVAESIIDLVGETPILKLRRVVPPGSADVFVKLEYLNPGGSVKDRAAIGIIRRAERRQQGLQGHLLCSGKVLCRKSKDYGGTRRPGHPHT